MKSNLLNHLFKFGLVIIGFISSFSANSATKLNPDYFANGSVANAKFPSSNFDWVVYRGDSGGLNVFELFSVNTTSLAVTNLSVLLVPNTQVNEFSISPNGNRVVFRSDKEVMGQIELYSVPIAGGVAIRLNPALNGNKDVASFKISPDSTRVVYMADQDVDGSFEVYSALINSPGSTQLNAPFVPGGQIDPFAVEPFAISPDGTRVVYQADQAVISKIELYSSLIAGGGNVKLNGAMGNNQDVNSFSIAPNSSRVVYQGDQSSDDVVEVYSVPLSGGASTKLNGALVNDGDISSFKISPDSSRTIYLADQNTDTIPELYSVPINGGANVKLNGMLIAGKEVMQYDIAPNSSRVVYLADQSVNDVFELYSVPLNGGANVKLNGTLVNNGDVIGNIVFSPNSSVVVYSADQTQNDLIEIYSTPLAGGINRKLNGTMALASMGVTQFKVTPDSKRVVYAADQTSSGINEIFSSNLEGNIFNTKINNTYPDPNRDILDFELSFQSDTLVYTADLDLDNTFELYLEKTPNPTITSSLNVDTLVGTNFQYNITASNGPLLGFGASNLPFWASINSNVITGIPNQAGVYSTTLFATNAFGFASAELTINVLSTNSPINQNTNVIAFNGDFNGDGTLDFLAQKKTKVTLVVLNSNQTDISHFITLSKGDRVAAANRFLSNTTLVIQNKNLVKLLTVDSNFNTVVVNNLGSLVSLRIKVMAAGDINGDKEPDIITQKGKNIGALLSPGYTFNSLFMANSGRPKVVGVLPNISGNSNTAGSLLLARGKNLFYYEAPLAPSLGEGLSPQAGPVFEAAYRVSGVVSGSNLVNSRLILSKGKEVGVVKYGVLNWGAPSFQRPKTIGKIVGPR